MHHLIAERTKGWTLPTQDPRHFSRCSVFHLSPLPPLIDCLCFAGWGYSPSLPSDRSPVLLMLMLIAHADAEPRSVIAHALSDF